MNMWGIVGKKAFPIHLRVFLAPMSGCTDLAFRRVARRRGCPFAFAEMVKDRPVLEGNRETLRMLRTEEGDRPLGVQLLGRDPELLREAARRVEGMGVDLIDLNLGCPVPKVVRSGCGAALLREPDRVGRIVEAVAGAVGVPVTVKIRSGEDGGFVEVARVAARSGAAAVIVHGRPPAQGRRGEVDLVAIRRVKEAVEVPVIGNGGIRSGEDARRMVEETGCDGVMTARGALGNPWIFREVSAALEGRPSPPTPSPAERSAALREHFAHLRELYGDALACRIGRKVFHWYVKGVPGAAALRGRGNALEKPGQFEELVREFEDFSSEARGW